MFKKPVRAVIGQRDNIGPFVTTNKINVDAF